MDSIETEESSYEASSNYLAIKSKKSNQEEDSSIFPKEFIILEKIYTLKEHLNNISFEREANVYRYDTTYLDTRKHYSWFKFI